MTKDLVSAIQRIEAARAYILVDIGHFEEKLRVSRAKVEAFDAALAELNKAVPEEDLPVKAPRLDIGKAVLAKLSGGPLTVAQLALAIGRKPSQVRTAIERLGSRVEHDEAFGIYRLAALHALAAE